MGTTPTPSMATPLPSSCTSLTVDPKHITPVSQRSQRPSQSHISKSLNFEMPTHTMTACAAHPVSPASSFDSSIHDLGETSVKCKRGRPGVSRFQSEKRQELIQAVQGNSKKYQYISEDIAAGTPKTKAKEKSRIR